MRNKFEEQLEKLHVEMIQMGALCEDAISAAAEALILSLIHISEPTRRS